MYFRNMIVFRTPLNWCPDHEALKQQAFRRCETTDVQTRGWTAPRHDELVHTVNGHSLIVMETERRLLPGAVVKQAVAEHVQKIEENEGRKVGRKERRDLTEAIAFELRQKAFTTRKKVYAWIDPEAGRLCVEASSASKAEELVELLHMTYNGTIPVKLPLLSMSPAAAMAAWLADGDAPEGLTLDNNCELVGAEKNKVKYTNESIDGDDVRKHIAKGKLPTSAAMTWADKISFVLRDTFAINRIAVLDIIKESSGEAENADERFDIDFTLMAGEYRQLINHLIATLGGEKESGFGQ